MLDKTKEKLEKIPLWFINLISLVSGIIAIVTPIYTIVVSVCKGYMPSEMWSVTLIVCTSFLVMLYFRMRKYRDLAEKRMEYSSEQFHRVAHELRDVYFEVLHRYKLKQLNYSGLADIYKNKLKNTLDCLCELMNSFTEKKVSACIKLISYQEDGEIDQDSATLVTFCRSANSNTNRDNYEKSKEIFLKENTDFSDIVNNVGGKNYFYKSNLIEYDQQLKAVGQEYQNTNKKWSDFYRTTIVVPIRIECDKLYHQKKKDPYHIIGFICVDSMDTDAFTKKQETYNVGVVKAFADIIYISLSQFNYYSKKMSTK